jgi:lipopolysaccharide transport system permease protein
MGQSNPSEVVYTPGNSLRHPHILFRQMWSDLANSFEPAYRLLKRDISAEYRQSLLGIFWAIIAPVFGSAAFILANNAKIINVGNVGLPYPAYVMFSMVLWQIFLGAFNAPLSSITSSVHIMTRIKFRYETAILKTLGHVFWNALVKSVLVIGLFVYFKINLHLTLLFFPVAFVMLILFGLLLGMIVAPVGSLYHDISKIIELVMPFLMFITPVIYAIPESGKLAMFMKLNPITYLLLTARESAAMGFVSFPVEFIIISVITFLLLPLAWLVLRISMPYIIERMSA